MRTRVVLCVGGALALALATAGVVALWPADHAPRIASAPQGSDDPTTTADAPPRGNDADGSPTAAVAAPASPGAVAPLDETALMATMRSAETTAPDLALELAREGNRRFPGSPDAAERAAAVVQCLARMGRVSEARGEAEIMVNQYAGTPWAREVEQHTGAHPHRNR
jgi:hypothetical protein